MTKSEMRRLQFQRKYTSNEDYEKDKAKMIDKLHSHLQEFRAIQDASMVFDLFDLLKQSKWAGLQNTPQKIPYKKPEILRKEMKVNG